MGYVQWPDLEELKQVLDIRSDDWDGDDYAGIGPTRLTRLLAAAIAQVKADVANWDDYVDEPDENLAQAALRAAQILAMSPGNPASLATDSTYQRLIRGHRRRFGIS